MGVHIQTRRVPTTRRWVKDWRAFAVLHEVIASFTPLYGHPYRFRNQQLCTEEDKTRTVLVGEESSDPTESLNKSTYLSLLQVLRRCTPLLHLPRTSPFNKDRGKAAQNQSALLSLLENLSAGSPGGHCGTKGRKILNVRGKRINRPDESVFPAGATRVEGEGYFLRPSILPMGHANRKCEIFANLLNGLLIAAEQDAKYSKELAIAVLDMAGFLSSFLGTCEKCGIPEVGEATPGITLVVHAFDGESSQHAIDHGFAVINTGDSLKCKKRQVPITSRTKIVEPSNCFFLTFVPTGHSTELNVPLDHEIDLSKHMHFNKLARSSKSLYELVGVIESIHPLQAETNNTTTDMSEAYRAAKTSRATKTPKPPCGSFGDYVAKCKEGDNSWTQYVNLFLPRRSGSFKNCTMTVSADLSTEDFIKRVPVPERCFTSAEKPALLLYRRKDGALPLPDHKEWVLETLLRADREDVNSQDVKSKAEQLLSDDPFNLGKPKPKDVAEIVRKVLNARYRRMRLEKGKNSIDSISSSSKEVSRDTRQLGGHDVGSDATTTASSLAPVSEESKLSLVPESRVSDLEAAAQVFQGRKTQRPTLESAEIRKEKLLRRNERKLRRFRISANDVECDICYPKRCIGRRCSRLHHNQDVFADVKADICQLGAKNRTSGISRQILVLASHEQKTMRND